MAARMSMASLITRLRMLIHDPAGSAQQFTDDELQAVLDSHRRSTRYAELTPVETITSGGSTQYLEYSAGVGDWEEDEILTNGSWATLTPATNDRVVGRWTFSAHQAAPVLITGKYYDLAGAAGELWETKAAALASTFSFSADGASYQRNQQYEHALAQAERCKRRAWPVVAEMRV